jgi:hypothetical protein
VLDQVLRHALAVLAGPRLPGGAGALVEPEGGDDRLERTAVAQQGHDERDQFAGGLEPEEGRADGGGAGPPAGGAAIAAVGVPPMVPPSLPIRKQPPDIRT